MWLTEFRNSDPLIDPYFEIRSVVFVIDFLSETYITSKLDIYILNYSWSRTGYYFLPFCLKRPIKIPVLSLEHDWGVKGLVSGALRNQWAQRWHFVPLPNFAVKWPFLQKKSAFVKCMYFKCPLIETLPPEQISVLLKLCLASNINLLASYITV